MNWQSPLKLKLVPTPDSESFKIMKEGETGLPLAPHPGAFGVKRKHHFHEGIDLYCPEGTAVHAVEDGVVVAVIPFTGVKAGLDWWEDTDAVLVEGKSGVVVYGEVFATVKNAQDVKAGDIIGNVKRVLKTDKGRPMSMLHLELHTHGAREAPEWPVDGVKPVTILDPTEYLINCHSERHALHVKHTGEESPVQRQEGGSFADAQDDNG